MKVRTNRNLAVQGWAVRVRETMDNSWFFEKFELIAELPDAIPRMRELVLELAVQGRLVEQSKLDEPASELVQRIAGNRDRLKSIGEWKGGQLPPVDRGEHVQLPSNWEWVRLGDVANYATGAKVDSATIPKDAWLLDLEDIEPKTSRLLNRKRYADNPSASTKTSFLKGDLLYGKLRPYLNKVIVADNPGFCTTEIVAIRSYGLIDANFLRIALRRPAFVAYATEKSYGMNLPRLSTEDARLAPIPLPPLSEQHRIVSKVEELLGICDRLEEEQRERELLRGRLVSGALKRFSDTPSVENLGYLFHGSYGVSPSDLRKTILTLAVQGKLVPQDPKDEPAEELLSRIKLERNDFILRHRLSDLADFNPIDHPPKFNELPPGWIYARLADLGGFSGGGTPSKSRSEFWHGTIPWVSPKDMKRPYIDSAIDNVTEEAIVSSSCRLIPSGSLLMVVRGMILVHSFPVAVTRKPLAINQDMKALVPVSVDMAEYLLRCLAAFSGRVLSLVERSSHGTCRLSSAQLASLPIPLPPLSEQRRIVAKVEELMTMVDELEQMELQTRQRSASLLDAIVHRLSASAG